MKTILSISCKTISINTLIVVLCLVIYSIGVNATVRYVKPIASGSADGSSWANASNYIQSMIDASAEGDSIWVAAGEYKPYSYPPNCIDCSNSRHFTFYIKSGIRLFGNFNGTETAVSQRDFGSNTTFLSGDLYGDDVVSGSFTDLEITGNEENVYHVVLATDMTGSDLPITIDGFTIKGGNANHDLYYTVNGIIIRKYSGGGILVENQFITIINCFIVNNFAKQGGGIYCTSQNTIITNNIIANNIATNLGGGTTIYNSMCEIKNNSFIGNKSQNTGGAIYGYNLSGDISNNEIIGNTSGFDGGGLRLSSENTTVFNNIITNNYAGDNGGAMFVNLSTGIISNNIIAYNTAGSRGGGLFNWNGPTSIINNIIYNNNAIIHGGGIYIGTGINNYINNTIVNNIANYKGGGIFVDLGLNTFTNNILWDNKLNTESDVLSADLFLNAGTATFQNNMLQLDSTLYTGTNYSLGANTQGNLFAQNPLFLNSTNPAGEDLVYYTQDDGLRLRLNSPALNAGTLIGAPTIDILNFIRDAQPDIGAYEHGVYVGIHPNTNSQPTATLNAYPNPATDAITFTFTTPITDYSTLILYAIDGRNITSLYKGTTQASQTNTVTIDTKGFTPGTYCAVLRCGNELAEHRTIVVTR